MKFLPNLWGRIAKIAPPLLAAVAMLGVASSATAAIFNVIDSQGVIYEKVPGTTNHVILSADTRYAMNGVSANLVITDTIVDVSTNQSTDAPQFYLLDRIEAQAFANRSSLKTVDIQAHITEIPDSLFYYCTGLTSVKLSPTVRTIGSHAFHNCTAMATLSIPEEVTSIGAYSFYNTALTSITLPNISTIPTYAFAENKKLKTATFGGALKRIEDHAFYFNYYNYVWSKNEPAMTSVTLGNSLEYIGDYAFRGQTKLKFPTMPDTNCYWGKYSFQQCLAMGDIIIPQGVTMAGYNFYQAGATSVTWPENHIEIGEGKTFKEITVLTTAPVPAWMVHLTDIYSNSTSITTLDLAIGVKTIEKDALVSMTALTGITFPEGFETLKTDAIKNCNKLLAVKLVKGMSMETNGFNKCSSINSITFPDEPMGEIQHHPFGKYMGFVNGTTDYQGALRTVVLPSWMKDVPVGLFENFNVLAYLTLPEGIETIGEGAFKNNIITNLKLPSTLKKVGDWGFAQYTNIISSLTFPEALTEIGEYSFANTYVRDLTVPATLKQWSGAFQNTLYLNKITIAEGQTSVQPRAFRGCTYHNNLTLASTVTEIGDSAFALCINLPAPKFPEGLKRIGKNAFRKCENFHPSTTIAYELPGGIEIDDYAFSEARIGNLKFPEEKIKFGKGVFFYTGIWQIASGEELHTLPAWMDSIPDYTFANNPFENLVMGGNVKHVGDYAFAMINPLKLAKEWCFASRRNTTLPTEPCTWGQNVFRNTAYYRIKFPDWMTTVPYGFCSSDPNEFIADPDAGEDEKYFVAEIDWNKVEVIEPHAFEWQMIGNFNLPPCVKSIGESAFQHAYVCWKYDFYENQKEDYPDWEYSYVLTLGNPGGVKIEKDAFTEATVREIIFKGCDDISEDGVFHKITELKKVTLAPCMTTIPDNFLRECSKLEDVVFEGDITHIGRHAFYNDSLLKAFPFPESLQRIDDNAFGNCTSFDKITWPKNKIDNISRIAFRSLGITDLTIPQWMDDVPYFRSCKQLENVIWEDRSSRTDCDSIVGIGFEDCTALKEFSFPKDIEIHFNGDFRGCTALEKVSNVENITYLEGRTFDGCNSLTDLPVMDRVQGIPYRALSDTKSLKKFKAGKNVKYIGEYAFSGSGIEELELNAACDSVAEYGFAYTNFIHLDWPGNIPYIPAYCFDGSNIQSINICEGTKAIYRDAFQGAQEIKKVDLPSTIRKIPYECFRSTWNLDEVTSNADSLAIDDYAFQTSYIKRIVCKGVIDSIGYYAFDNTDYLTDVVMKEGSSVKFIGCNAFYWNHGLRHFPYLKDTHIMHKAFYGCSDLIDIVFPEEGVFLDKMHLEPNAADNYNKERCGLNNINYSNYKLQSITFPDDDHYFRWTFSNYDNASLEALSYVNDTQLIPYDPEHPEKPWTLAKCDLPSYTSWNKNSNLVVRRNEKWKFHQAEWNRVFKNIMEKKEPELANLTGCIYSEYKAESNRNLYTTNFMWDLALSDLNTEKPTQFTVFRDNEPIATVEFSVPERIEVEDQPLREDMKMTFDVPVYSVTPTVKYPEGSLSADNTFLGNFDFLMEQENGDSIYQVVIGMQWEKIYYDATTSKRLATFEKYGHFPWFVLVDRFYSPVLSKEDAPQCYTYHIEMVPYEYDKPVNNAECEVNEETGLRYHTERVSTGPVKSRAVQLYPTMAMPSLDFNGLYSEAQIRGDRALATDTTLAVVTPDYVEDFRIAYKLDPKIAKMRGRYPNGTVVPVVDWVQVREVKTDTDGKDYTVPVSDEIPVEYGTDFSVKLPDTEKLDSKKRYITVTHSEFRGDYGSLVMSVPDIIDLDAKIVKHEWSGHNHVDGARMHSEVKLTPNASALGYDNLSSSDYYIGIWRHFNPKGTTLSLAPQREDTAPVEAVLLHHCGDNLTTASCDDCANSLTYNEDGTVTYHDYFDVDYNNKYDVGYTARVYVKVPDSYIPGETRYMLAQSTPGVSDQTVSGIEEVKVDPDSLEAVDGMETWYDLRGIRVETPIEGQLYIRVTPAGSEVVRK